MHSDSTGNGPATEGRGRIPATGEHRCPGGEDRHIHDAQNDNIDLRWSILPGVDRCHRQTLSWHRSMNVDSVNTQIGLERWSS